MRARRPGDYDVIPEAVREESVSISMREHRRWNRMPREKVNALLRIRFSKLEQPQDDCSICLDPYEEGDV